MKEENLTMKKTAIIVLGIALLVVIGIFVITSKNTETTESQTTANQNQENNQGVAEAQPVDESLLEFVEKDSAEYKNAAAFSGKDYDQYFIANMIHYSEGLAKLEAMAEKSANVVLSNGAAARAQQAQKDVATYKQLQKDKGYPASYGQGMQYHAAMGADSQVYFAVSSLEGLTGDELEVKLTEQLKYFWRAETLLAGAGVNNASDKDVKDLVVATLITNAVMLKKI